MVFLTQGKGPKRGGYVRIFTEYTLSSPPTPLLYKNGPQGPLWCNNGHRLFSVHLFKSGLTTNLRFSITFLIKFVDLIYVILLFSNLLRSYCASLRLASLRLAFMKSSISLHGRRLIFSHDESFSIGMRVGNVLKADVFSVS